MTTRQNVADVAAADDGYLDGNGYPGTQPNKYDDDLGWPQSYSCGAGVTVWYKIAGLLLPPMQSGLQTGFASCPIAHDFGQAHGIIIPSWHAQPADIVLYDWNRDGVADHTEVVLARINGVMTTEGADSGPSNIPGNPHTREGGTHRHQWSVPDGTGNTLVLAVLDASRLVTFTDPNTPPKRLWPTLMLTSPLMGSDRKDPTHFYDIAAVQKALNAHGATPPLTVDGVWGPKCHDAAYYYEQRRWPTMRNQWTGCVSTYTREALGLPTGP